MFGAKNMTEVTKNITEVTKHGFGTTSMAVYGYYGRVSQYIAAYCSISQYIAVYRCISQYIAVFCSISQYIVVHRSILHFLAVIDPNSFGLVQCHFSSWNDQFLLLHRIPNYFLIIKQVTTFLNYRSL